MDYRTEENCLILLRGLPGAGKSTLAKMMSDSHYEADMYFTNDEGEYHFDPLKLKQAHQWCQDQVHHAMLRNHVNYGLDDSIKVWRCDKNRIYISVSNKEELDVSIYRPHRMHQTVQT